MWWRIIILIIAAMFALALMDALVEPSPEVLFQP
jgi:hypothetical protein